MTVPRSTVSLRQWLETFHFALLRDVIVILPVRVVKPPVRVSTVKLPAHDVVFNSVTPLDCVTVKTAPFAVTLCLAFGETLAVPRAASTLVPWGTAWGGVSGATAAPGGLRRTLPETRAISTVGAVWLAGVVVGAGVGAGGGTGVTIGAVSLIVTAGPVEAIAPPPTVATFWSSRLLRIVSVPALETAPPVAAWPNDRRTWSSVSFPSLAIRPPSSFPTPLPATERCWSVTVSPPRIEKPRAPPVEIV